jgi:hypothetical protein
MHRQMLDAARQSTEQAAQRVALEPTGCGRGKIGRTVDPLQDRGQVATCQIPNVAT